MLHSKSWLTMLVAFVLLAFTFTPALAQSFPPGHTPPLGDLEPVNPADLTPAPADPASTVEIGVDTVVIPTPVSPKNNFVTTRTPKFFFTPVTGASQYHLVVVDTMATPDALVYHYYGTGSCTTVVCMMQPANTLKTLRYEATKGGVYAWAVEAMISGAWKGLSVAPQFAVLSSGFTSDFNLNTNKWAPIYGTWTRTDKGYYKAIGPVGKMTSAMQKEFFMNDYVYEVTLKRKVEADSFNRIIFMGIPKPLAVDSSWDMGYYFGYYNSGHWGLWRRDGGVLTLLHNNVATPFVIPYGWNKLTVWTDYPTIHLWINSAYLGYFTDDTHLSGFVGVGMYENYSDLSPLLVDSATLYYSATAPYAITDAVLGEPQNHQVEGEGLAE